MRAAWRGLSLTLLALCALTVGCAGSPATRFYVLTAVPAAEPEVGRATGEHTLGVGVRRVTLPHYLSRPQIVTRQSPTELHVAEFHRWAAPLTESFAGTLAENLAAMLPAERVAVFPWARTTRIDYEVAVDVLRFEGALGGPAVLLGRWSVADRHGKQPPLTGRVSRPATPTRAWPRPTAGWWRPSAVTSPRRSSSSPA
jgi:uncharacterized lipoprotein YmbA